MAAITVSAESTQKGSVSFPVRTTSMLARSLHLSIKSSDLESKKSSGLKPFPPGPQCPAGSKRMIVCPNFSWRCRLVSSYNSPFGSMQTTLPGFENRLLASSFVVFPAPAGANTAPWTPSWMRMKSSPLNRAAQGGEELPHRQFRAGGRVAQRSDRLAERRPRHVTGPAHEPAAVAVAVHPAAQKVGPGREGCRPRSFLMMCICRLPCVTSGGVSATSVRSVSRRRTTGTPPR